jgi:hypothetical protein
MEMAMSKNKACDVCSDNGYVPLKLCSDPDKPANCFYGCSHCDSWVKNNLPDTSLADTFPDGPSRTCISCHAREDTTLGPTYSLGLVHDADNNEVFVMCDECMDVLSFKWLKTKFGWPKPTQPANRVVKTP